MVDSTGFGLKASEVSAHVSTANEHQEAALDEALVESLLSRKRSNRSRFSVGALAEVIMEIVRAITYQN